MVFESYYCLYFLGNSLVAPRTRHHVELCMLYATANTLIHHNSNIYHSRCYHSNGTGSVFSDVPFSPPKSFDWFLHRNHIKFHALIKHLLQNGLLMKLSTFPPVPINGVDWSPPGRTKYGSTAAVIGYSIVAVFTIRTTFPVPGVSIVSVLQFCICIPSPGSYFLIIIIWTFYSST